MRAITFPKPESINLTDAPDPPCGDDEVIVRVGRAGLCGTDVHIYRNEYLSAFPLIPGHEFCGTITQVGRDVGFLSVGERVAVDPNLDCGHCAFCRRQQNNQCLNWQGVGITRPGGFAQYVAVPARAVYRVPEALSDAQAAFIEPLSCVVHAMNRLSMQVGEAVLILGAGPMGLLLVQMLRQRGAAQVVAVDKLADRLDLARQLGATDAVLADERQAQRLRDLAPHGFDVVVDATGVPAVIERGFDHLRPYGRFLQFGVTPRDATVRVSPYRIFKNDWTILGTFALCYTFEQAIALLASGAVKIEPLISHTLPLSDFREGFDAFTAGRSLRVHFLPDR